MIWGWLLGKWGRFVALAGAVLAAVAAMRWDARRDAIRDKEIEDKEADHDRADEIRRRVDAARNGGGLHPDDRRGYRD
jgi:hypothetical protein